MIVCSLGTWIPTCIIVYADFSGNRFKSWLWWRSFRRHIWRRMSYLELGGDCIPDEFILLLDVHELWILGAISTQHLGLLILLAKSTLLLFCTHLLHLYVVEKANMIVNTCLLMQQTATTLQPADENSLWTMPGGRREVKHKRFWSRASGET